MKRAKLLKPFAKLLLYILEHNPYEFGLIPDKDGYVKLKELIQAVNEEEGWKHINKSHVDDLLYLFPDSPIELSDTIIRAKNGIKYPKPVYADNIPGEVYAAIRQKAQYHVYKNGLSAADNSFVIMSSKKEIAHKIGKRKDKDPIILSINTTLAEDYGVFFYKAGDSIYLAKQIPSDAVFGPPLPEKKKNPAQPNKGKFLKKDKPTPGSYIAEIENVENNTSVKTGKRDKTSWKNNKKKLRKQKQKYNTDY